MKNFFKTLSLAPRGIKHKLTVAFALMSVIPMLVCGYLIIYYIFPIMKDFGDISLVFVITIFLVLLGFYLAKKIIYPVVDISAHVKGIAEGKLDKELKLTEEDEIGELSGSLNQLSATLKENMSRLHSYGEKIKQINMEINRKVFALSSLLQINNLITTTCSLDEVLQLIVERVSQLETQGPTFLMLLDEESRQLSMRVQKNMESEQIRQIRIKIGQGLLGKVLSTNCPLIIDAQKRLHAIDKDLKKILPTKNIAVLPVTSSGKVIGILGTGNNIETFLFSDDEIELIGVFTKQVTVAVENDILLRKTEELNVRDELTGLYNESYIRSRLDEEIKRAVSYQRPCSFIIFEIGNFKQYRDALGAIVAERALKKIAQTLKVSTTDIDKVARFSDHQFAVILPEKNKRQCLKLAENIKKEIERFALQQKQAEPSIALIFSVGISATPIDGITSVELINRALSYIEKAKGEGTNKIVTS